MGRPLQRAYSFWPEVIRVFCTMCLGFLVVFFGNLAKGEAMNNIDLTAAKRVQPPAPTQTMQEVRSVKNSDETELNSQQLSRYRSIMERWYEKTYDAWRTNAATVERLSTENGIAIDNGIQNATLTKDGMHKLLVERYGSTIENPRVLADLGWNGLSAEEQAFIAGLVP